MLSVPQAISPANGIFFTKDGPDAEPVKAEFFSCGTSSEQIVEVPDSLTDGQYRLSITTQAGPPHRRGRRPWLRQQCRPGHRQGCRSPDQHYTRKIMLKIGRVKGDPVKKWLI